MTKPLTRQELYDIGQRAAYRNMCNSVIVAEDHTGEDNYHNCSGSPGHEGNHYSGAGYEWDGTGTILDRPSYVTGTSTNGRP